MTAGLALVIVGCINCLAAIVGAHPGSITSDALYLSGIVAASTGLILQRLDNDR